MKDQIELEVIIRERLNEIKPVPARDPRIAARARAQFIARAVSANEFQRHKGWTSIFRKEQFAMNALLSILVIAGLLFGGGATVNAAQDDLPDEPLYALKTWSEDVGLKFQDEPEQKVDRLMELAQIRIQEMTRLTDAGQAVPDQVRLRLEQHIHQALQMCSNMDDATLDRTLLQLRDRLQQQDRGMERLQLHAAEDAQPILERTRTLLRERLQLVEGGLLDHEMFRNAAQNGFRYGQTLTPTVFPPSTPSGPNGQQNGQSTPQAGPANGPGPNTDPGGPNPNITPAPDNSNNEQGPNSNDNTSDGNGPGGNGSGGNDSGGNGSGGNEPGGNKSGGKGP